MSATEHCSAPERNDAQSLPLALAHVRQLPCRSSLPRARSKPRLKATSFTLLGAALGVGGMAGGAPGGIVRFERKRSSQYGLDPKLPRSAVQVESNFNRKAASSKGTQGLMQLMPETARELGVNDSFDVRENVNAGVRRRRIMALYGGQQ